VKAALLAQFVVDAPAAIGLAAGGEFGFDPLSESLVLPAAGPSGLR